GGVSFAYNFQVFGQTDSQTGYFASNNAKRTFEDIRDGTSNTLMFTEKYSGCTSSNGNVWAQSMGGVPGIPPTFEPVFAFPGPGSQGTKGSQYVGTNGPGGKITSLGSKVLFQVMPLPYDSNACDPFRAQSTRTTGIIVSLCDGSTRFVSTGISAQTWWTVITPSGGEVVGSDF